MVYLIKSNLSNLHKIKVYNICKFGVVVVVVVVVVVRRQLHSSLDLLKFRGDCGTSFTLRKMLRVFHSITQNYHCMSILHLAAGTEIA